MHKFFIIFCLVLTSCSLSVPKKIYESDIKADSIIVDKSDRKLYLLRNGRVIKDYEVKLGSKPDGDKIFEGDGKTPEGNYFISNKNPNSKYFLSLLVSYPSKQDIELAERLGKKPGGEIMIHGQPNDANFIERIKNEYSDWTAGCIAVSDKDMIEIYSMVDVNTPILIRR